MKTQAEALKEAKELISDPNRWCREYSAQTSDGGLAAPRSKEAVRWCALGACARVGVGMDPTAPAISHFLRRALQKMQGTEYLSVPMFNDTSTHAQVMKMFDVAIEIAEAKGQ